MMLVSVKESIEKLGKLDDGFMLTWKEELYLKKIDLFLVGVARSSLTLTNSIGKEVEMQLI